MRILFLILPVFISGVAFSQEKPEMHKNPIVASATFSINSNGIAPVPAFALGKPALVSSVSLVKGRFSYDPNLAYGIIMKPWYIDNWFHYRFIDHPKFVLKGGVNFSVFCSGYNLSGEEILKAERYFAFSMEGIFRFSPVSTLTLDYWSDNGQERGSLRGHFAYVAYDRSALPIGTKALFSANLMIFYINYTGRNNGLFFSPKLSLSLRNFPASIFFQATQAIQSDISPWPGFKWNMGISYSL